MTEPPRSRLASLVDRRPATAFFALTLAISWGLWIPILSALPSASKLAVIPGAFGPALAAATVIRLRGESVRAWFGKCLDWRVAPRWYGVALGLPLAFGATMGLILVVAGGRFDAARLASVVPMYPVMLAFTALLGGGQEEFGWRGLALPALQERFDAVTASVVVGVVWAVWHLPLFAFDVSGYAGRSFLLYAVVVVGFSLLFTWLYNGTGGSVLLAVAFHGGINAASSLGGAFVANPMTVGVPIFAAYGMPVWVAAGAVLVRFDWGSLSAGPAVTSDDASAARDAEASA